jgi:hypothetical protein
MDNSTPPLSLYSPLDEDKEEIRLITFPRESRESGLVHCNLETVPLKPYSPEYQRYTTALNSRASKRRVLATWTRARCLSRLSANQDQDAMDNRIPVTEGYRFPWGDYAALSYVWGDENSTSKIVVNGRETRVTRNLEVALRALRKRPDFEAGYKLWVDALCINQKDYEERDRQICKMQNIYGNARAVIAWLGEEENESDKAINLIESLSNACGEGRGEELEARLNEEPDCLGNGGWLALHELMNRPYWTRLWIIQEIVLGSSRVVIRCGNSFIDWGIFCAGIRVLFNHLWMVKDWLLARELALRGSFDDPRWMTVSLHLVYKDLRVLSQYEEQGNNRLSFGRLLEIANSAHSRDIRDKVYGLVGMMDPAIAEQLAPDYMLDPSRIFADVAKAFILTDGNLEPLRESNPWGKTNAPSWAADWTWDGRLRYARTEVPVWGPFWTQDEPVQDAMARISYRASGKTPPEASFSNDNLHLTCRGFLIDKIAGLSARGAGYFSWLEESIVQPDYRRSVYGDYANTAKALYHALVLDRVGNGQTASDLHAAILSLPSTFQAADPQFRKLGWKWLTDQGGYYFRWETWRLANKKFWLGDRWLDDYFTDRIPDGASEYDYTEVYSCFDRTCKSRRFMTTSNGYLGWAPDNIYGSDEDQTREGDLISIIFGCSTPLVIRPYGKLFKVVGEAYVQGLMDGEAMKFLESGEYPIQDFTFC